MTIHSLNRKRCTMRDWSAYHVNTDEVWWLVGWNFTNGYSISTSTLCIFIFLRPILVDWKYRYKEAYIKWNLASYTEPFWVTGCQTCAKMWLRKWIHLLGVQMYDITGFLSPLILCVMKPLSFIPDAGMAVQDSVNKVLTGNRPQNLSPSVVAPVPSISHDFISSRTSTFDKILFSCLYHSDA